MTQVVYHNTGKLTVRHRRFGTPEQAVYWAWTMQKRKSFVLHQIEGPTWVVERITNDLD